MLKVYCRAAVAYMGIVHNNGHYRPRCFGNCFSKKKKQIKNCLNIWSSLLKITNVQ